MSQDIATERRLRKQLVLLELESSRLEIAAGIAELRSPFASLRLSNTLAGGLGGLGGKLGLITSVAAMVAGPRVNWWLRLAPLAIAGWRIALLLRARRAARQSLAEVE